MKIITFYSYKGGVGRSLALVNIANRLAEFGKKVCILDFDLEAPGLDSKYANKLLSPIKIGLADYIYSYSCLGIVPKHIKDYVVEITAPSFNKRISFIPAGNTDSSEYWKKLSSINWWNLFYGESSYGIDFFLNFKQQVEEELAPDYLLIDSRTGITEMSSVSMSILADKVVVLAANNDENIKGCARVLEALTRPENDLLGKDKEIHFVLTRIPFETKPDEISQNQIRAEQKIKIIRDAIKKNKKELTSVNVIHSDPELEIDELCNAFYSYKTSQTSSATEYLNLFSSLIQHDFTKKERETFNEYKHYQLNLDKARWYLNEKKEEFYEFATSLLEKYPRSAPLCLLFTQYYLRKSDWEKILEYSQKGLECSSDTDKDIFYFGIASSYVGLNRLEEALKAIEATNSNDWLFKKEKIDIYHLLYHKQEEDISAITTLIDQNPSIPDLYNQRASYYRYYKKHEQALEDVYKALEIDTEFKAAYTTLAEIKYEQGDINEFYRNMELALKYGYDMRYLKGDESVYIYKKLMKEERFINLMRKYNQEAHLNDL